MKFQVDRSSHFKDIRLKIFESTYIFKIFYLENSGKLNHYHRSQRTLHNL